jgi:hypothetical protein
MSLEPKLIGWNVYSMLRNLKNLNGLYYIILSFLSFPEFPLRKDPGRNYQDERIFVPILGANTFAYPV